MTEDHREQADAAEHELADLEERSQRVGEHIDEARKDWEAKLSDPDVPGAGGNPDRAEEGGRHPETAYPAKGSAEEVSEADVGDVDGGADDAPHEHGDRDRAEGELPPPEPRGTD